MERDALIAHGTSFLLQDRLMNCSDYSTAWVCRNCGSLVSLGFEEVGGGQGMQEYCRICDGHEPEHGEESKEKGVGVVMRGGEKKGRMDVVPVPCKCRFISNGASNHLPSALFALVNIRRLPIREYFYIFDRLYSCSG